MAARPSRPRAGRHFLNRRTAAELVRRSGFAPDDLVVEVGAGAGALTRPLAEVAGRVLAVELDAGLASQLARRVAAQDVVEVLEADVLRVELPREPFRVFGNVPFGITTALLRRLLDDPATALRRADIVVQREVARKRSADPPRNLLTLSWAPWWRFQMGPRLPAEAFHPRPRVEAAVLTITRRLPALLPAEDRGAFIDLLEHAFRRAGEPLPRALRGVCAPTATRAVLAGMGVSSNDRPVDLTAARWVDLFAGAERLGALDRRC